MVCFFIVPKKKKDLMVGQIDFSYVSSCVVGWLGLCEFGWLGVCSYKYYQRGGA